MRDVTAPASFAKPDLHLPPYRPSFHARAREGLTFRNRADQPFPFVETPAKTQFARSVETQPCADFATLPALCVVGVAIIAA